MIAVMACFGAFPAALNWSYMDWLVRDGRSLGDPSKNPWCGDFVETCIRMALPDESLLGARGTNPYWARNWPLFGQTVQPITGAMRIWISAVWRSGSLAAMRSPKALRSSR